MLAWSYHKGLAIPKKEQKRPFVGGLSRLLKTGYSKNVLKLDLNKLTAEQWDKITEIASGYKAKAVFDEFLKKETDPVYRKTLNDFYAENKIGKTEFLNPRIWNELDDKFLIDNGFIQTDAAAILEDYAWKLGHKINEEKYFGYGSNYVFRYLEPIREELIEKGYEPVKAKELTEKLLKESYQ